MRPRVSSDIKTSRMSVKATQQKAESWDRLDRPRLFKDIKLERLQTADGTKQLKSQQRKLWHRRILSNTQTRQYAFRQKPPFSLSLVLHWALLSHPPTIPLAFFFSLSLFPALSLQMAEEGETFGSVIPCHTDGKACYSVADQCRKSKRSQREVSRN